MNLNHQIAPAKPSLNVWHKLNEVIEALNWLMAMYSEVSTDGNSQVQIIPNARGPVFRVNNQASNQQPWATDPNGNPTGWLKSLVVDPNYNINTDPDYGTFDESWMWSGPVSANPPIPWFRDPTGVEGQWIQIQAFDPSGNYQVGTVYVWGTPDPNPEVTPPWLVDPSGNPADWVVCAQNTFWGTGSCPLLGGNFQQVSFNANGPGNGTTNPYILTGNVQNPPITIPSSPPAFYFTLPDASQQQAGLPNQPCMPITVVALAGDPSVTANFTWTITYDGTTIVNISGSVTAPTPAQDIQYYLINPLGWQYDPGGLPGYAQGSKKWIYQYQGAVSGNTNPTFVETFSFSTTPISRGVAPQLWNTTVLTK